MKITMVFSAMLGAIFGSCSALYFVADNRNDQETQLVRCRAEKQMIADLSRESLKKLELAIQKHLAAVEDAKEKM